MSFNMEKLLRKLRVNGKLAKRKIKEGLEAIDKKVEEVIDAAVKKVEENVVVEKEHCCNCDHCKCHKEEDNDDEE